MAPFLCHPVNDAAVVVIWRAMTPLYNKVSISIIYYLAALLLLAIVILRLLCRFIRGMRSTIVGHIITLLHKCVRRVVIEIIQRLRWKTGPLTWSVGGAAVRQNGELTMSFAMHENSSTGSATAVNFKLHRFVTVLLIYVLTFLFAYLESSSSLFISSFLITWLTNLAASSWC